MFGIRRREFITLLGGAALAWPLAAHAQQLAIPVIGFLNTRSPDDAAHEVAAFHRGLSEGGFVEGRSVTVEYRWALGQYDRLPGQAAELVHKPVAVLVSTGASALAAKAATATIPIVFVIGGDAVKQGLAASYNRPGGNATGIMVDTSPEEGKRLGLLHEIVPQVAAIGVLLNPSSPQAVDQLRELQETARAIGLRVHVLRASSDREIEAAFETIVQQRIAALFVVGDPFFDTRRDKLVALATRHAVPTSHRWRDDAVAGGLMSYGADLPDMYRQAGLYTARILKGEKPADLPVLQPTKYEFIINLKTAKALGLTIPWRVLAVADEVIE